MVAPRVYHGEYTLQETVILTQLNLNMQARDLERMVNNYAGRCCVNPSFIEMEESGWLEWRRGNWDISCSALYHAVVLQQMLKHL